MNWFINEHKMLVSVVLILFLSVIMPCIGNRKCYKMQKQYMHFTEKNVLTSLNRDSRSVLNLFTNVILLMWTNGGKISYYIRITERKMSWYISNLHMRNKISTIFLVKTQKATPKKVQFLGLNNPLLVLLTKSTIQHRKRIDLPKILGVASVEVNINKIILQVLCY